MSMTRTHRFIWSGDLLSGRSCVFINAQYFSPNVCSFLDLVDVWMCLKSLQFYRNCIYSRDQCSNRNLCSLLLYEADWPWAPTIPRDLFNEHWMLWFLFLISLNVSRDWLQLVVTLHISSWSMNAWMLSFRVKIKPPDLKGSVTKTIHHAESSCAPFKSFYQNVSYMLKGEQRLCRITLIHRG